MPEQCEAPTHTHTHTHTHTYRYTEHPQTLPAMWCSVSIVQQNTDLVLEDVEPDKDKQEVKKESEDEENLQPPKETVSLLHFQNPCLCRDYIQNMFCFVDAESFILAQRGERTYDLFRTKPDISIFRLDLKQKAEK